MRLAWLTDIHLNFVDNWAIRVEFYEHVRDRADAIAVSGDIAESPSVVYYLREMEEIVQKPIHFVLGNHDFYRGSIAETRARVAAMAGRSTYLKYLTVTGPLPLTSQTAIIGHDGWADGKSGDFENAVLLNDHYHIQELAQWWRGRELDKCGLKQTLAALADEAALHLRTVLTDTVTRFPNVIAVTHVPPYPEAAWYAGTMSDKQYLPYFACPTVGDVLRDVMRSNPQSQLTVLCGHTHGAGELIVLDNLRVLTGPAEYGKPELQRTLELR